jgi:hypothetical protein
MRSFEACMQGPTFLSREIKLHSRKFVIFQKYFITNIFLFHITVAQANTFLYVSVNYKEKKKKE